MANRFSLAFLLFFLLLTPVNSQAYSQANSQSSENNTLVESVMQSALDAYLDIESLSDEELKRALAHFQQRQVNLEAEHGAYHPSITENLISLARVYSAQEDYEQARYAVKRALEVQKVSTGLHRGEHIPIVEQIILVNRILEKWKELDQNYEYLYWLYRRVHGEQAVELLPLLKRYIYWKIETLNRGIAGNPNITLKKALEATKLARKIIGDSPVYQEQASFYDKLKSSLQRANNEENNSGWSRY